MGIECKSRQLNGVWSGCFYYDETGHEGVTFSVWLSLKNGRVSGSSLEPNTFIEQDKDELDAKLNGHVDGEEIVLLKTYRGIDQEPVYCEGAICDQGRKISGRWYFDWPNEITGTFEMERKLANARARETVSPIAPR